jgi:cytosine/adenosine deaminase-related metal-dependent hydrolase
MLVLQAGWVVPVVDPPVRHGAIAIEGGRVRAIGRRGELEAGGADVRDLGPGVLLPGLVNAHCHLELSHLSGRLDGGGGFVGWVEALVALRAADPLAVVAQEATRAIAEMEASGTIAVGDVSNTLVHVPQLAASGLRAVVFHELLSWDPQAAPHALAAARACMEAVGGDQPSPSVRIRPAAHAPHSVSAELMAALVAEGGPAALHLAESREETRFLASGDGPWAAFLERRGLGHVRFEPPRASPVQYVDSLGVLRPGLVAAHAVQTDAEDRRRLAAAGVFVALCPRSNRNLGVGTAAVPDLLADGVRLCLGTDSLASVDTLDLVDDMVELHRAFPGLDPAVIVRTATAGGAAALGFDDLGSIAPGRSAALAFAPGPAELRDPYAFLVSGEARLRPVGA